MSVWCCGLHADFTHKHILFCWVAMQASSLLLSHAARHGMYRHIIMRGGVSRPLHYAWSLASGVWKIGLGASHTVGHMSVQSHHLSVDLKHTQIHKTYTLKTPHSVAWQICTRTHSPTACQTKVSVIRSVSRFHSLWIGYANAIQHRLMLTWQIYIYLYIYFFLQRSCTKCSWLSCRCTMLQYLC